MISSYNLEAPNPKPQLTRQPQALKLDSGRGGGAGGVPGELCYVGLLTGVGLTRNLPGRFMIS